MALFGTIEMGGTKTDVSVGLTPEDLADPVRLPTTSPQETLGAVVDVLSEYQLDALGVAAFGPIDLDPRSRRHGRLLATPKSGWSGADILGPLSSALGVPIEIDTDVNGAALGEGRWGAARGMDRFAYMTVGTGVGVGVVVNGKTIRGATHPEAGHVSVERMDGDDHFGSCPYHGACLEGMAAGPSLEARFGDGDWRGDENVLRVAAHYVAQGVVDLIYTIAPDRVIVGGGVASLPYFHDRLRTAVRERLAGYPVEADLDLLVSQPGLGKLSGLAGGLVLAEAVTG